MPKVSVISSDIEQVIDLPHGFSLADTDDVFNFACKAAACGRCKIEVIQGMDNLSPVAPKEQRAITVLGKGQPAVRFACQVKVFGDCQLKMGVQK